MRVCSSILLIATIGLAPGSGLAQDNLPAAPSATREQRKPQSPPAADPAKTDNSAQQEQSNVAPKPADVSAASRTSPAPTADEDAATTIRVPVNEVNVIFTVTDKHGRYVKNLKKSDSNWVKDTKRRAGTPGSKMKPDCRRQLGLLVKARNSCLNASKSNKKRPINFLTKQCGPDTIGHSWLVSMSLPKSRRISLITRKRCRAACAPSSPAGAQRCTMPYISRDGTNC